MKVSERIQNRGNLDFKLLHTSSTLYSLLLWAFLKSLISIDTIF